MKVFQVKNQKVTELKQESGKKADENEKMVQNLIENNLSTVFPSIEFLTSEYQIDNLRPDSIAFDNDRGSFVIVEYKNVKHKGVVDQGMSYYKLLQEKKENFVLLYHKIKGKVLDTENDVNWDETRVIFISPEFTEHQKRASQSKGELPIELYEIAKFENGIITLNKIEDEKTVGTKSKNTTVIRLEEYSEDDFLKGKYRNPSTSDKTKQLFFNLKNMILDNFPDIENKQKKKYAGFYSKKDGAALCTITTGKDKLILAYSIRQKNFFSPSSFIKYMVKNDGTKIGHWGLGDYISEIKNNSDIETALPLLSEVYEYKGLA